MSQQNTSLEQSDNKPNLFLLLAVRDISTASNQRIVKEWFVNVTLSGYDQAATAVIQID